MIGTHAHGNANAPASEEIELLAKETKRPIAMVKMLYDAEFSRLKMAAKVPDYVALLASRHTREMLLRGQP